MLQVKMEEHVDESPHALGEDGGAYLYKDVCSNKYLKFK